MAECIRVFLEFMDVKQNTTTYAKLLNETTVFRMFHPDYSEFFEVLGKNLADLACRLVRAETLCYHRQKQYLNVENWGSNNYSVVNA